MAASLKMSRATFALLIGIVVAGSTYLCPLIPIAEVRGFVVAVAAAAVVWLGTKEEEAPSAEGSSEPKVDVAP